MFIKKKKKLIIEKNEIGDKGYQMKDEYNADDLVIARLERISSEVRTFGPMVETTTCYILLN